jgi:hypothetical protein
MSVQQLPHISDASDASWSPIESVANCGFLVSFLCSLECIEALEFCFLALISTATSLIKV